MERQPFVIGHPQEIARLFGTGYMNAPDGTRWNISFTPGIKGTWRAFINCLNAGYSGFKHSNKLGWRGLKHCLTFACNSLKWGWNFSGYGNILKFFWNAAGEVGKSSLNLIGTIPDGVAEGADNISKLYDDAPFGWIPRIIKNALWNCFGVPILKFLTGASGVVLLTPGVFIIGSLFGVVSRCLIGNIGACFGVIGSVLSLITGAVISVISIIGGGIASFFPLIGGTIISTGVALGAITNRFPKPLDNGTYGLNIVN